MCPTDRLVGRRNERTGYNSWVCLPKHKLLVGCPSYILSCSAMRDRHIHCYGANSLVTPSMAFRHIPCDAVASRETRDRLPSHLRPYLASDALQRGWGRESTFLCERLSCMCISSLSSVLALWFSPVLHPVFLALPPPLGSTCTSTRVLDSYGSPTASAGIACVVERIRSCIGTHTFLAA